MDNHPVMAVDLAAHSHQQNRKLRNKRRHLTKEEKDLAKWKSTYEVVLQTHHNYFDHTLRKLRLSKLFKFIKENLKKRKNKKPKMKIRKASMESLKKRWQQARKKGNEYSKLNKFQIFVMPSILRPEPVKIEETPQFQARRARAYGNMFSKINLVRLQSSRRKYMRTSEDETPSSCPIDTISKRKRNQLEYGIYYSMRNKLTQKDSVGQFDNEYQDLLLKCVSFEKEHIDISGFLEEKFRSNIDFRRGILELVNQQEVTREREFSHTPAKRTEHKHVKTPCPVASSQHTQQIVQLDRSPSNEMFNSYTKIARPLISAVPSESIKSETVVHAYKYASNDHLHSSPPKVQWQDQVRTTTAVVEEKVLTITNKYDDNDLQRITETVTKNQHFEDIILDVMKNHQSVCENSTEMQKLLSDLYLAFCMNLMKTAVNEKVIKEEVDMVAVKDAAIKQADVMSEALSEIFRHRNG